MAASATACISSEEARTLLSASGSSIWNSLTYETKPCGVFRACLVVKTSAGQLSVHGPWACTSEAAKAAAVSEVGHHLHKKRRSYVEEHLAGSYEPSEKTASSGEHSGGIVEERSRLLPKCLEVPSDPLHQCLFLHALQISSDSPTLGILLPAVLEMPFCVYPPGGKAAGCLKCVSSSRFELTHEELEQVAEWSFRMLTLFGIPLAPVAQLLNMQIRSLNLLTSTGELSLGEIQVWSPCPEGHRDPCCIAVPLDETGLSIDWVAVRRSLDSLSTAQFPDLVDGLSDNGRIWKDTATGESMPIGCLVVAGYGEGIKKQRRSRRQFFTEIVAKDSSTISHSGTLTATVLHRSFKQAGGDTVPRDGHSDAEYVVDAKSCYVVPVTGPLARTLMLLPAVLWQAEVIFGSRELLCEFASPPLPVRIDDVLLRIALTRAGVQVGLEDASEESCGPLAVARAAAGPDGERLEFLGDALLKFASRVLAFLDVETPMATEGELTTAADAFVGNAYLRDVAERLRLVDRMVARRFERGVEELADLRKQPVTWKAPADVTEAVIGAVWLSARASDCIGCDEACDALLNFYRCHIKNDTSSVAGNRCGDFVAQYATCCSREERHVVNQIMDNSETMSDHRQAQEVAAPADQLRSNRALGAQRLELLGDALLQALVSEHVFFMLDGFDEGGLHQARVWLVGNDYLARCAAKRLHGDKDGTLSEILKELPGGGASSVQKFLQSRDPSADRLSDLVEVANGGEAPKCLGDLYEVLVAARFMSCNGSLRDVWQEFRSDFEIPADIMKDLVRKFMAARAGAVEFADSGTAFDSAAPLQAEVAAPSNTIFSSEGCAGDTLLGVALEASVEADQNTVGLAATRYSNEVLPETAKIPQTAEPTPASKEELEISDIRSNATAPVLTSGSESTPPARQCSQAGVVPQTAIPVLTSWSESTPPARDSPQASAVPETAIDNQATTDEGLWLSVSVLGNFDGSEYGEEYLSVQLNEAVWVLPSRASDGEWIWAYSEAGELGWVPLSHVNDPNGRLTASAAVPEATERTASNDVSTPPMPQPGAEVEDQPASPTASKPPGSQIQHSVDHMATAHTVATVNVYGAATAKCVPEAAPCIRAQANVDGVAPQLSPEPSCATHPSQEKPSGTDADDGQSPSRVANVRGAAATAPKPVEPCAKSRLNQLVMRRLLRPLNNNDVVYESIGRSDGQFECVVRLHGLAGTEAPEAFKGNCCRTKKEAEKSAASVALSSSAALSSNATTLPPPQSIVAPADAPAVSTVAGSASTEDAVAHVGAVPTSIPETVSQAGSSIDVPQQKEQSNAKSKLNEIMMGRLKRPVKKGDIEYTHKTPQFTAVLRLHGLGQEGVLEFCGEMRPNKKDAEQSAAEVALRSPELNAIASCDAH